MIKKEESESYKQIKELQRVMNEKYGWVINDE